MEERQQILGVPIVQGSLYLKGLMIWQLSDLKLQKNGIMKKTVICSPTASHQKVAPRFGGNAVKAMNGRLQLETERTTKVDAQDAILRMSIRFASKLYFITSEKHFLMPSTVINIWELN